MVKVGMFTEAQIKAKEDKAACNRVRESSGGAVKYFTAKIRKRGGRLFLEVVGMTTEEYCNSNII